MVLLSDSILYLELGNEISTVVHGELRLQRRINAVSRFNESIRSTIKPQRVVFS